MSTDELDEELLNGISRNELLFAPEYRTRPFFPDVDLERLKSRKLEELSGPAGSRILDIPYAAGPQATKEDLPSQQEIRDKAKRDIAAAESVILRSGDYNLPGEVALGRSELIRDTGGYKFDKETGEPVQMGVMEHLYESLKRQRILEAGSIDELARQVREGEKTREEAGLSEGFDVIRPLSEAGVEEDFLDQVFGFVGAVEPFAGEGVFGGDRLYYRVDDKGEPLDPTSFAYKADQYLMENFPAVAGTGILPLPIDTPFFDIPRPFQPTRRHVGQFAAATEGNYVRNALDQVAKRRVTGHEFEDLPLYDAHMAKVWGDSILGMRPSFAAGTAVSVGIPTPFGAMKVLGMAARKSVEGAASVAESAAKAAEKYELGDKVEGITQTALDILRPGAVVDRLATRAASRKAVGVDMADDALEAPTMRTVAVDKAVSPAATPLELAAVAREALDEGGTLNLADMNARFGGNATASRILQQAAKISPGPIDNIDPRALDDVANVHMRAADFATILNRLSADKVDDALDAKQAIELLKDMVSTRTHKSIENFNEQQLSSWLRSSLKKIGHVPNTKNTFVNAMYATGTRLMDDVRRGIPASEVLSRTVKGLGAQGRLFQDNLMRTIIEEAALAGKDVSKIMGQMARKTPSTKRLSTMLDALGDGRGGVAIAKAFRETMNIVGRDRIMQHLPDDYVFVSSRFMVPNKKLEETTRAMGRAAKDLFRIVGTRTEGQVVEAATGKTIDDVIEVFVSEVGPTAVRAEEGSTIARSIIRKLKKGAQLNEQEAVIFADTMRDAMARRITGLEQAVTEGAQTALARNLAGVKNALYDDAYSGVSIGRLPRGMRRLRAAANEALKRAPLYKEATRGNAAASMATADLDEKASYGKKILDSIKSWYSSAVKGPIVGDPFYGYFPQTSVISETYARRIGDLVATAADRTIKTMEDLAGGAEKLEGPALVTRVVRNMSEEVNAENANIFRRRYEALVRSRAAEIERTTGAEPTTIPLNQIISDAEAAAQSMVSKVTVKDIADPAENFRLGQANIDNALRSLGYEGGIKAVRKLSGAEAVQAIQDATVMVLAKQKNSDDWVSMLKTLMPGKASAEFILKGVGQTKIEMTLAEAVEAIKNNPALQKVKVDETGTFSKTAAKEVPVNFDKYGNLIPDLEGTRAVLELLIKKNGSDYLNSTLQYSDAMSFLTKFLGNKQIGNQAWEVGVLSWLVHQRAGIDAARVFNEMADVAPEMILNIVPDSPVIAKALQEASVMQIIDELGKLQQKATNIAPEPGAYRQAFLDAHEAMARGNMSGRGLPPLTQAMLTTIRQIQTIDFSLSVENRFEIGSEMIKAMASGRAFPDMFPQIQKVVDDAIDQLNRSGEIVEGAGPRVVSSLSASSQKMLKKGQTSVVVNERIKDPLMEYWGGLIDKAELGEADVLLSQKNIDAAINDIFYAGILNGSDSVFAPIYRQLDNSWRQAGLVLDGGFVAGLDSQRFIPKSVAPAFGSAAAVSGGINIATASAKLEAAIASGRLQSNLENLSVRANNMGKGEAVKTVPVALAATKQLAQTLTRTARSTLLAGGGIFATVPNLLYHFGNIQSVPEILIGTIGAENALKAAGFFGEGLSSAARNARSWFFRQTISRALAPITDPNRVVINSPFYGDITAKELDDMMDMVNIKFSRASIEAYESIGSQMMQAAKLNLGRHPLLKAGKKRGMAVQFLRMFNPASMHEWMKFAEDTDGITKRAVFAAMLADGRTIEQSAMLAREALLDYGKVASSGTFLSQFAQKWTMFWAFRRQSLIMTVNALAEGNLNRGELMGRWIRTQQSQKKGSSPEEFLFGKSYTKSRMYFTPNADEYGFNAGAPSIMSEGLGDWIGYMSTVAVGIDAAASTAFMVAPERFTPDALKDPGKKAQAFSGMIVNLLAEEQFDVLTSTLAQYVKTLGREDDNGPLVSDVFIAQTLAYDSLIGTNVFPTMVNAFNLEIVKDKEGRPVVSKGRPYLQSETDVSQRPHEYRFGTNTDYAKYLAYRTAITYMGMARTPDEWTKLALTLDELVPSGYKPAYRGWVNTLTFMTRLETPMRATDKHDIRAQIRQRQKRRIEKLD